MEMCKNMHKKKLNLITLWPFHNVKHNEGHHVALFQKGQIIVLHQAKKTTKEINETIKSGLRSVQHIIKSWKDSGEPSSSRKKYGWKKKSWMMVVGDHLNVRWNLIIKNQQ